MITILDPTRLADAFRRAAVRATLAPSVHNTQPWRLRLGPESLDVYADRERQLAVHDPTGRQLLISCGCALFNARASLAADSVPILVRRFPDGVTPGRPCAEITVDRDGALDDGTMTLLDKSVECRRTNILPFTDDQLPDEVFDHLRAAAAEEGVRLLVLARGDETRFIDSQHRQAASVMQLDPAYRTELRAWRNEPDRGLPPARSAAGTPGPERLALIVTEQDHPSDWLRAGEALERVLLEAARTGCAVGLSSQIAEVPSVRTRIRRALRPEGFPHVLLRIGVAPPSPVTRRRRLGDVIAADL